MDLAADRGRTSPPPNLGANARNQRWFPLAASKATVKSHDRHHAERDLRGRRCSIALGLKLIAVVDEAALKRNRSRLVRRNKSRVRIHSRTAA
jgi:hypothetical protein